MTEAEWRKRLKAAHMCRQCQKQDAYTLAGRTFCAECAAKDAERHRKARATPEGREKMREANARFRQRCKELGLCKSCGKRKPMPGEQVCETCLARMREHNRERRRESGINIPRGANGFCWQCNKQPAIEGKRMCQECYDRRMAKMILPWQAAKGRRKLITKNA